MEEKENNEEELLDESNDNSQNISEPLIIDSKEKEYLDRIQRLQAEFENFRKRSAKEKLEYLNNANFNLIYQLLDVLDNFELSLKHNKDKGVMLIYDSLIKILEKQGLRTVSSDGVFDPKIHEVIMSVNGKEDGTILEEFSRGYFLNDKLLRASKVKISKVEEKK